MGQRICRRAESTPQQGYYYVRSIRRQAAKAMSDDVAEAVVALTCKQCAMCYEHYQHGPQGGMSRAEAERRVTSEWQALNIKRRKVIDSTTKFFALMRKVLKQGFISKREHLAYEDSKMCMHAYCHLNRSFFTTHKPLP